jgi:hypothetical protein
MLLLGSFAVLLLCLAPAMAVDVALADVADLADVDLADVGVDVVDGPSFAISKMRDFATQAAEWPPLGPWIVEVAPGQNEPAMSACRARSGRVKHNFQEEGLNALVVQGVSQSDLEQVRLLYYHYIRMCTSCRGAYTDTITVLLTILYTILLYTILLYYYYTTTARPPVHRTIMKTDTELRPVSLPPSLTHSLPPSLPPSLTAMTASYNESTNISMSYLYYNYAHQSLLYRRCRACSGSRRTSCSTRPPTAGRCPNCIKDVFLS